MSIYTEFHVFQDILGRYHVGAPMSLRCIERNQNEWEAYLLGMTKEEHYTWRLESGAEPRGSDTFKSFAYSNKKDASKVARVLSKAYLNYWRKNNDVLSNT